MKIKLHMIKNQIVKAVVSYIYDKKMEMKIIICMHLHYLVVGIYLTIF